MVGYQLVPVQKGFSAFTPTFKGIGNDLDLTTIEVCNANGEIISDMAEEITIQLMDEGGYYRDTYGYWPDFGGWEVDMEPIEPGTVTFKPGYAVCVNNTWEGDGVIYLKVSGEVDLVNKNEIRRGFSFWGNSTPVAVDLTEIDVVDKDGVIIADMAEEITLQVFDEGGYYRDTYAYWPDFGGWEVDMEALNKGDVIIQPGESFCVNNTWESSASVWLKLPCPVK